MNNQVRKNIVLKLDFLPEGDYEAESWADAKNADKEPAELDHLKQTVKNGDDFKVSVARNGGCVTVIKRK